MERVGDYELLRDLAEAGTGRLHLARRAGDADAEPLVVKVLHERFRRNAFYTATLFSEAASARRFRHPVAIGTVDVADVDGKLVIVMEQASGPSWQMVQERARAAGRRFSTDAITWLGQQVASMLAVAAATPWADGEAEGLVVGQLAPRGVFLTKAGEVRVVGTGLGRSRICLPPTRARLAYRAPELFARERVRPASDVYGLGLLLYDALAGAESFQRDSVAEVKAAVLEEALPPLSSVHDEVASLLSAMTAKDPDERPADLDVVARTLRQGVGRDGSLLSAEWAEHVRVLFPELFEPERGNDELPVRGRRVSVPYSQTATGARRPPVRAPVATPVGVDTFRPPAGAAFGPSGGGAASSPAPGPPAAAVATSDVGPSTYDIEDLAELLASGSSATAAAGPRETPRSSPRAAPVSGGVGAGVSEDASRALAGLDDGSGFDVDSVVDAIFASSEPRRADSAPGFGAGTGTPEAAFTGPSAELLEPAPRLEATAPDDPWRDAPALSSQDLPTDSVPAPRSMPSEDIDGWPASMPDLRSPISHPSDDMPEVPPPRGQSPESGDVDAESPTLPPAEAPSVDAPPADEEPPVEEPQLQPGAVIQDRYRIIAELGRGGMSIVYRAEHTLLLKEVALKLLRPELSTLGHVVERFQREARSVCRLDDPNIVRVTDFGGTAGGLLYLIMELIQGESLGAVLAKEGRLPVRAAIALVDQILAGLEHAHRFEIIHRDLKPDNIMLLAREGGRQVKILDFGIAKLGGGDEENKSITQVGTVFGTPRYMSPEQAAGEPVDHRTDLYTVGVILYQLLTGRVPFHGETTVQLLAKVLTQDPPPMEFEAPHEGARLQIEAVTMKALAKEPEDRFESARAFREALDGCLLF